jgi:predicted ATP-grasp superfamily ATP-dependent carboligase
LLCSLSGRGLAKAALRAGQRALVIDAFGDRDTRALALNWAHAPMADACRFEARPLLDAAANLCPPANCGGLIYGSGFESQPAVLARLAAGRRLLGNTPEVLAQTGDPARFFALLRRLGIPHPEVRFSRPSQPRDWLSKQAGACGGSHILPASASGDHPGRYFQRHIQGQTGSLLFLANGREVCPVGFNLPLPPPPEAPNAWAWSGAARLAGSLPSQGDAPLAAARRLTQALGLRGLNGIDFILDRRGWKLLELNPRPTATLELWDVAPMPSLLNLHVRACQGHLSDELPSLPGSLAMAVVYAGEQLSIPADFIWPDWCSDLPAAGSRIAAGEPICTVRAAGDNSAVAAHSAEQLRGSILRRLRRTQAHESRQPQAVRTAHPTTSPTFPSAADPAWACSHEH